MKKILLLLLIFVSGCTGVVAQQFDYGKIAPHPRLLLPAGGEEAIRKAIAEYPPLATVHQRIMELGLINPEHEKKGKMLHNDSHKFESTYVGLTIPTNRSVMFGSLSGSKLGIWVAHGEGKFSLPYDEDQYNVVAKYSYDEYPGNPNGSDYSIAGLASADGRHLAMMPHLERAIFPWQNGCYPADRKNSDQITPWIEAFVNARKWVEEKTK